MLIQMEEFICMFWELQCLFVFYFVKLLKKGLHEENIFHDNNLESIKSLWKKRSVEILWMAYVFENMNQWRNM